MTIIFIRVRVSLYLLRPYLYSFNFQTFTIFSPLLHVLIEFYLVHFQ